VTRRAPAAFLRRLGTVQGKISSVSKVSRWRPRTDYGTRRFDLDPQT